MVTILLVTWRDIRNPEAGGEERYLYEISSRLATGEGDEVVYLCSGDSDLPRNEKRANVTFVRRGSKLSFFLLAPFYVLLLTRKLDVDVLVENITGVPFFTPLYSSLPIVGIKHHLHDEVFFRELSMPLAACGWLLESTTPRVYRDVPFITVSRSSKEQMERRGYNVEYVIRNGVSSTLLDYDRTETPNSKTLLYLGRIKKYKDIEELVDVFVEARNEIDDLELLIAGTGDHEERIRRRIIQEGVEDRVRMLGYVDEAEKRELLERADLFVTPSKKEGWGITIIEANALETPAVGYDVPGLRDSIRDGRTGVLCPESKSAMAESIVTVLEDDDYREFLAENAREWARNFDWENTAKSFRNVVENETRNEAANETRNEAPIAAGGG